MPTPLPGDTVDLDPVEGLVVEALGDDERDPHFCIRGQGAGSEIALVMEPEQLAGLTTAAGELLQVLQELYPRGLRRSEVEARSLERPPRDDTLLRGSPVLAGERVRQVNVAHFFFSHEAAGERVALLAVELPEEPVSDGSSLFRFWLSREQVANLILQTERLLGMPPTRCPICGQPVGVNDHQCPREN